MRREKSSFQVAELAVLLEVMQTKDPFETQIDKIIECEDVKELTTLIDEIIKLRDNQSLITVITGKTKAWRKQLQEAVNWMCQLSKKFESFESTEKTEAWSGQLNKAVHQMSLSDGADPFNCCVNKTTTIVEELEALEDFMGDCGENKMNVLLAQGYVNDIKQRVEIFKAQVEKGKQHAAIESGINASASMFSEPEGLVFSPPVESELPEVRAVGGSPDSCMVHNHQMVQELEIAGRVEAKKTMQPERDVDGKKAQSFKKTISKKPLQTSSRVPAGLWGKSTKADILLGEKPARFEMQLKR